MASVRTIGPHPGDKELVTVRKGRFGPYVQHGKTVANLPRGVAMEDIALDAAVTLLAEKGKALKQKGGRRGKAPAKAAAKAAPTGDTPAPRKMAAPNKKAAAKKPAAKKTVPKAAPKVPRKAAE